LIARGTARKGEMPPEAWTALADPYATQDDVRRAMQGDKENGNNGDNGETLRIFYSDGLLYATKGDVTTAIMMILEDSIDIPVAREALGRILGSIGEALPDDIEVADVDETIPSVQEMGESLVIAASGRKFIEMDGEAELMAIHDAAENILARRGIVLQQTDF
jgi:hypothetical protein